MVTQQYKAEALFNRSQPVRLIVLLLIAAAGVIVAGALCQTRDYRSALAVIAIALGAGVLVYARISIQRVLIWWFVTTPLLSYYVRFPIERSILTYDRVIVASVVLALLLNWLDKARAQGEGAFAGRYRFSMTKFEIAWALLALLALCSAVRQSSNVAYATRLAVDTFLLPVLVFHIARRNIDLRLAGRNLWLACVAVALFLFFSGAFEFTTGIDLFAFKGAEIVREGERRVNGPFSTDSSFAVICLMLFLFLWGVPRMLNLRLSRLARLTYAITLVAAGFGVVLPLFRTVAGALVVCWLFLAWVMRARDSSRNRLMSAGIVGSVILLVLVGLLSATSPTTTRSRLTNPRTAYGRLATWEAAAKITLDNPVFGTGLGNYPEYFDATHYYAHEPREEVAETKAVDSPHSNLLWISSELGLSGLVLYIAANLFLLLMGWRAFKNAEDRFGRGAACCFLALSFAYWIPGLTLTTGYYSDLNLCFFFLTGALSGNFAQPLSNRRSTIPDFAH